jgi:thymidylate synthase (FAD)
MSHKKELYGDGIGSVELIDFMGSDLTIVNAARVSFGKQKEFMDDRDRKLISYLAKHKHTSTFEHNVATFRFTVPLFIRSQHMRHRTWAYNEISRRYTDVDMRFYEPKHFRSQHKSNRQASTDETIDPVIDEGAIHGGQSASYLIRAHHKSCLKLYDKLIDNGVCREQARGVLPQNLYTEYYGTVNLNNLLKFIGLRIHVGAQWEIQQVANALLEIASDIWPVAVNAYSEEVVSSKK